jgi:histidinol-phosphatase (PHP family)
VHYIEGGWDIDNPGKLDQWRARDAYDVWSAYFERLTAAADSGLFEIIGHPDLPKKFRFMPNGDCVPLFERFWMWRRRGGGDRDQHGGVAEGLSGDVPEPGVSETGGGAGVGLTFGSDAHQPGEVGMNFAEAVALAREAGYRECLRFEKRRVRSGAVGLGAARSPCVAGPGGTRVSAWQKR